MKWLELKPKICGLHHPDRASLSCNILNTCSEPLWNPKNNPTTRAGGPGTNGVSGLLPYVARPLWINWISVYLNNPKKPRDTGDESKSAIHVVTPLLVGSIFLIFVVLGWFHNGSEHVLGMLLGFLGFHNDSEHVLTLTHLLATNMLRTIVKSIKSKQHSQNMLRTIVKSVKSKQHSQNMLRTIVKSPKNKKQKNKDRTN